MAVRNQTCDERLKARLAIKISGKEKRSFYLLPRQHLANVRAAIGERIAVKTSAISFYVLQDWPAAGLHNPSAFRVFLATLPATSVVKIGHLSDRDWQEIQTRLRTGLAV
jgi:hypothetical protein